MLVVGIIIGAVLALSVALTTGVSMKTVTSTTVSTSISIPPSVTTVDVAPSYGVYSHGCSLSNKTCSFFIVSVSSPVSQPLTGPVTIYTGLSCLVIRYGSSDNSATSAATGCLVTPANYIPNDGSNATLIASFPSDAFGGGSVIPTVGESFSGCISLQETPSNGCLAVAGVFSP